MSTAPTSWHLPATRLACHSVLTALLILGSTVCGAAPSTLDEFDGPELVKEWQRVSVEGEVKSDLAARPGWLTVTAASGQLLELRQTETAANLDLLTRIDPAGLPPAGVVGLSLRGDKEHIALLRSQDETPLLTLSLIGPSPDTTQRRQVQVPPGPLHLCLRRRAGTVKGYWSTDGDKWETVGELTISTSRSYWPSLHAEARGAGLTAQFGYYWLVLP
jgi:hypothetical protein